MIPAGEELLVLATVAFAALVGLVTVVKWLMGPAETHEPTMRRGWARPTGGGHWVNDSNGGGYQPYDCGSSCPSGLCTASRSNMMTAGEVQAHDAARQAWFTAEAFGEHASASTGMSRADLDALAVDRWDASHPTPAYSAAPSLPSGSQGGHNLPAPAHSGYNLPSGAAAYHNALPPVHDAPALPGYTPLPAYQLPAGHGQPSAMSAPQHRWSSPEIPPASKWGPPALDGNEPVEGDWKWADSRSGDLVPINRK